MKIKDIDDAFFWWLEEIPVDEIDCETARDIITKYRKREYDVMEASERLELFCEEPIRNWISLNKQLAKTFKAIKEDEED